MCSKMLSFFLKMNELKSKQLQRNKWYTHVHIHEELYIPLENVYVYICKINWTS